MTDDNFHKLALSESFERVAKVAEERQAFNKAMDNLIAQDADLIDINNKDGAVLLRCPFCDGEAKITTCDLLDGDQWACVCCKVCNAQIVNEDEEDAITAWNTRNGAQAAALEARGLEIREKGQMKQVLAAQLAEWLDNNTRGYANRDGNRIKIEGEIDAYELLLYVQSLINDRSTSQIQADNRASYTGRSVAEGV